MIADGLFLPVVSRWLSQAPLIGITTFGQGPPVNKPAGK